MILQIDKRMTEPDIVKYGCHYMSELFLINRCGNVEISIGIIIAKFHQLSTQLASYQPTVEKPTYVIGPQCAMNNPDDIVTEFGLKYRKPCRFEGPEYQCTPEEQELLQFERPHWWHWVAGEGKGNVAYDPEGYSLTVAQGRLVRKKIFTIVHEGVNA